MKTLKFILRKVLYPSCAIFTFLSFFVIIIGKLTSEEIKKPAITLPTMLLFFIISVLISLSGNVFSYKKMNLYLRALLHMVLSSFSLTVSISLFDFFGYADDLSAKKLPLIVVFCVFYIIIVFPFLLIRSKIESKKEKTEYVPMFKK